MTEKELKIIREASRCLRALVGNALGHGDMFMLADVCEGAFAADDLDRLFAGEFPYFGRQQQIAEERGLKPRPYPWGDA